MGKVQQSEGEIRLDAAKDFPPPGAEAIGKNSSMKDIEQVAVENGMVPLRARCLERISQGTTTIEEFQKCKF